MQAMKRRTRWIIGVVAAVGVIGGGTSYLVRGGWDQQVEPAPVAAVVTVPDYAGYDTAIQRLGYSNQMINRANYADDICDFVKNHPGADATDYVLSSLDGMVQHSTASAIVASANVFVCTR